MSEFSESFHLRSNTAADAIALLRSARVAGYVFPPSKGWVPIAYSAGARAGSSEHFERLVAANTGVLLHYAYAEDHGCYVDVYDGTNRVVRIKASFESQNARFDRDEFVRLGLLTASDAEAIERWVAQAHRWERRRDDDEYLVGRALGLPRFRWFAHRYELDNETPDVDRMEVDTEGRVKTAAPATNEEIEDLLRSLPPTRKAPTMRIASPLLARKAQAPKRAAPKRPMAKKAQRKPTSRKASKR